MNKNHWLARRQDKIVAQAIEDYKRDQIYAYLQYTCMSVDTVACAFGLNRGTIEPTPTE